VSIVFQFHLNVCDLINELEFVTLNESVSRVASQEGNHQNNESLCRQSEWKRWIACNIITGWPSHKAFVHLMPPSNISRLSGWFSIHREVWNDTRHGPYRKYRFQNFFYFCIAAIIWRLLSHCLATGMFTELIPNNGCPYFLHNSDYQQTCRINGVEEKHKLSATKGLPSPFPKFTNTSQTACNVRTRDFF
jgi:hypothetical protein